MTHQPEAIKKLPQEKLNAGTSCRAARAFIHATKKPESQSDPTSQPNPHFRPCGDASNIQPEILGLRSAERDEPSHETGGRLWRWFDGDSGRETTLRANLVQTCRRTRLLLVARTASAPDVLSNSYRALLLLAARFGGFKSRRPDQSLHRVTNARPSLGRFWSPTGVQTHYFRCGHRGQGARFRRCPSLTFRFSAIGDMGSVFDLLSGDQNTCFPIRTLPSAPGMH
jgi:hypothetical protein